MDESIIEIRVYHDGPCGCLGFHHTENDQKKRYRRSIIEETFPFEYQIQSARNSELLEYTERRCGIGRRYERTEEKCHDKWHLESEPTEYILEKNCNSKG